jgi:predicted peroxiredoxin
MKYLSRNLTFALAGIVVLAAVLAFSGGNLWSAPADKPGILVNITSGTENLHAVSMGLGLANTSLKNGHNVVVFLNVEAPVFAKADLADDVQIADFPTVKQLVASVIENGGKVVVCNHCAHVCGVGTDNLVEGAVISGHGEILQLIETGMVGFSY